MNSNTVSPSKLCTVKREQFREKIRKEDLFKIFQRKRQQEQKDVFEISDDSIEQNNDFEDEENSSSDSEMLITRLPKIGKRKPTVGYCKNLLKYAQSLKIKKTPKNLDSAEAIQMFCENALFKEEINDPILVPILCQTIYETTQNFNKEEDLKNTFQILLRGFCKYPDSAVFQLVEKIVKTHPQLVNFLDEFCKHDQGSLIQELCKNINYSKLQMIYFLCEKINNNQLFDAFKILGLKEEFEKNKKPQYTKLMSLILKKTHNV